MDDMSSTENMAKGLNVYKSGPKGAATKAQSGRALAAGTTRRHTTKTTVQLPPLRFTKTKSA